MINAYYKTKFGTVYTNYNGKPCQVGIYGGNCLCVFVYKFKDQKTGKMMESLVNLYHNKEHITNQIKEYGNLFITPGYIKNIRLNTYYKESMTLAKYFAQEKHTVTLFYKEPKK